MDASPCGVAEPCGRGAILPRRGNPQRKTFTEEV